MYARLRAEPRYCGSQLERNLGEKWGVSMLHPMDLSLEELFIASAVSPATKANLISWLTVLFSVQSTALQLLSHKHA